MGKYLLGIDNGGTLSKSAVFDLEGNELATHSSKTALLTPSPGFVERDMDELWQANGKAISGALAKAHIPAKDVIAVATTGHGKGIYLIDEAGKPVNNGIVSTDSRATSQVERWYDDGTFDKVYPKIVQAIWACHPAALLAWSKANCPELLRQTRWVLMCKDYVRFKLTGEVGAELTDVSGSCLYNVRDRCYDRELLEDLQLAEVEEVLPPLVDSAEICGTVTPEAAQATGLLEGTPVAGGLFDVNACAVSSGLVDEQGFGAVMGTWSICEYITRTLFNKDNALMQSLHCIPGYWLVHEASPTSASNLEWFIDVLMARYKSNSDSRRVTVYEQCDQLVSSVDPDESDPIFLPFLYGSNLDIEARSCFIGLQSWHGLPNLVRAVYEGVLFAHKTHIEKLLMIRNPPTVIRIAGGPVRSNVWMHMFADVLETPLEIVEGMELGAKGAAICAGVAAGVYSSFEEASSRVVRVQRRVEPRPEMAPIYRRKYEIYKEAIDALSRLWRIPNCEKLEPFVVADAT